MSHWVERRQISRPLCGSVREKRWHRILLAIACAFSISACAPPQSAVGLDGVLNIVQPLPGFSTKGLNDEWMKLGRMPATPPDIRAGDDRLYLHLEAGSAEYALLRRVQARLLATPFLAWDWKANGGHTADHPFRITIGLSDTPEQSGSNPITALWASDMPAYTRTITISWGASALQRGSIHMADNSAKDKQVARYTARGGRENLGRWWAETVDLSALHGQAWPELDMRNTRIVFVGVVMMPSPRPATVNLAALRLSR
ncbi:MAG: DUF3047 domain-containing protein [Rhodospirillaceae bacterium]|nr:DUF3047 domain-containing protein [Rhodospirillaceae bacterium]